MHELTIGDYFERVVSLVRSAVDRGMDVQRDVVRKEIATELDCVFGPAHHECDAVVGAIAMVVAAGYAQQMDLKASMIRWLKVAAQHPGGVFRESTGRRVGPDDVVR